MNLAEAANLVLTLQLKDQISSGLDAINRKMGGLNTSSATLRGGLTKVSQGIGTGIRNSAKIGALGVGLLVHELNQGIDSLVQLEDVTNQTNAAIESTGGAAGLTVEQIRDLAERMEELSGVDDKVIQSGENVLLTFTNIKEDAFEPATLAALNMSQAMDQDLQSSIVQIGKALNDPIKGMTALTRVGVTFSEEQKEVIKQLIATGDTAGAQKIILDELNKEFGGSAQASMEGYRGTQLRLSDTVEELQMALAEALLPALENVSKELREFLKSDAVKTGIKDLGKAIADLFSPDNVKGGGDALKGLFQFLRDLPWNQIKDGMSFAAENAKKVVDVFRSLPPGVQAGLLTFLAANKLSGGLIASGLGELAKVALSSLKTITAVNVTVTGANVISPGGGGIPPAAGAAPMLGLLPSAALVVAGGVTAGVVATGIYEQLRFANVGSQAEADIIRQIDIKQGELTNLQRYANSQTGTQQERLRGQIADLNGQLVALNAEDARITSSTSATNDGLDVLRQILGIGNLHTSATNDGLDVLRQILGVTRDDTQRTNTLLGSQIQIGAAAKARLDQSAVDDRRENGTLIGLGRLADDKLGTVTAKQATQQDTLNRAAALASEAKDRLGSIATSSATTAKKDLSVSIDLKTTFQVSAREVANAVRHIDFLQGRRDSEY